MATNETYSGLIENDDTIQPLTGNPSSATYSRDTSGGRIERRKKFMRAVYGEFVGTFIFLLPIFACLANAYRQQWEGWFTNLVAALVSGFQLVTVVMCFSSLSGAQLNPAITFALWLTKKTSNRKCLTFMVAQCLASLLAMSVIYGAFPHADVHMYKAVACIPPSDATIGNIFLTEFFVSFLLTFVAFAMAFEEQETTQTSRLSVKAVQENEGLVMYSSTPQSKAGFAPFAFGFTVLSLAFFGGGSGVGLNPARMFGPAVFANEWDNFHIYILGEFSGAAVAALFVIYGPQSAKREIPVINTIAEVQEKFHNFMHHTSS